MKLNPRVRLHRSKSVTVSGIDVRDLRDILTAASLHFYDTAKKFKAEGESDPMNLNWLRRVHATVDMLDAALDERVRGTRPYFRSKPTKAKRWEIVRQQRHDRLLIDEILASIPSHRKAV